MKTYKANAKVNIFLKITGKTAQGYHTLASRFMVVEDLFDTLYFSQKSQDGFEIVGDFGCNVEQNTIYKAYKALVEFTKEQKIVTFMEQNAIVVQKQIPAFAGLGGGSSDAATFLHMLNETLSLGMSVAELAKVGLEVGADVPFFVYGYKSANVEGIGEIVTPFEEEPLSLETYTPSIKISTPAVYQCYSKSFYHPTKEAEQWLQKTSLDVLETTTLQEANDLFLPAQTLYPELKNYAKEGWFFSGSGSSFFKKL